MVAPTVQLALNQSAFQRRYAANPDFHRQTVSSTLIISKDELRTDLIMALSRPSSEM